MPGTSHALTTCSLLALAWLLWLWQPAAFVWTTPEPSRTSSAALMVTLYLLLCGALFWRQRQRQSGANNNADITLVYASQSGTAQRLARQTARALHSPLCSTRMLALEQFDPAQSHTSTYWLFVVSTSGEGEPPDHALAFARTQMHQPADLTGLRYGLLALGDRSYANFCAFGRALDCWLRNSQATALFTPIEVDNDNADARAQWHAELGRALDRPALHWRDEPTGAWQLCEREHLNPGSPGGAIFRLALSPQDATTLHWQAGDIAEVSLPGANPQSADKREYSIASIVTDGQLELLVRQMFDPQGKPGRGSHYLTRQLQIGESVELRIRENRNFHPPPDSAPLILIGNGTGLAGLRAHMHARQQCKVSGNWLLFGERSRAHDRLFGPELEAALARGQLDRLDLTFSRESDSLRYVQHALLVARQELARWIDDGASILVCGSNQGMAPGVHAALCEILGQPRLDELRSSGRYRCDVY